MLGGLCPALRQLPPPPGGDPQGSSGAPATRWAGGGSPRCQRPPMCRRHGTLGGRRPCAFGPSRPGRHGGGGQQPGLTAVVLGAALAGLRGCRHGHEAGQGAGWGQGAGLPVTAHRQRAALTGAPLAVHTDGAAGLQEDARVSPGLWGRSAACPGTAAARPGDSGSPPMRARGGTRGKGASRVQGGGRRGRRWGGRCHVGDLTVSKWSRRGSQRRTGQGHPRGWAPPHRSLPDLAGEAWAPPCPSSETLGPRGSPAPPPAWRTHLHSLPVGAQAPWRERE